MDAEVFFDNDNETTIVDGEPVGWPRRMIRLDARPAPDARNVPDLLRAVAALLEQKINEGYYPELVMHSELGEQGWHYWINLYD